MESDQETQRDLYSRPSNRLTQRLNTSEDTGMMG